MHRPLTSGPCVSSRVTSARPHRVRRPHAVALAGTTAGSSVLVFLVVLAAHVQRRVDAAHVEAASVLQLVVDGW